MSKIQTLLPSRIRRNQGFSFVETLITLFIVACMIHCLLQTQWFMQHQLSQLDKNFLHWLKISNQYELTGYYAQ